MLRSSRWAFAPQRDWLVIIATFAFLVVILLSPITWLMGHNKKPVPYSKLAPLTATVDSDTDSFIITSGDIVKIDGKTELVTIFTKKAEVQDWKDYWVNVQYANSKEITSLSITDFKRDITGKHFDLVKKGTPEHTDLLRQFEKK